MSKPAVFTVDLDADLRDDFVAEAEASHQPASQVVSELMRGYVEKQREQREYVAFLQRKVDKARASLRNGEGIPNEIVEAEFAARRVGIADRA